MGNTGWANDNKSVDSLFYVRTFSFCVPPLLVVLVKAGCIIDVCF